MRLTAIILLAGCLQVAAKVNSQTITFSAKNADLQSVFQVIKKQTGFTVAVKKAYLQRTEPVNIEAVNMPLEEFLSTVFKDQPLTYNIEEQTIFLNKKLTSPVITEKLEAGPPPVTGVVKDSTGMPLNGATVYNTRTKKSVQTNVKGEFQIEGELNDILVLSYVGFENQNIKITGNSVFAILKASTSPLDEVQIKAYGTTSRRLNTGSITTIKGDDIALQPVTNPLMALQGRAPNLVISPTSGLPNGAVNLQLRGQNSLSSIKSEPLIIVDGIPFQNNLSIGTFGSFGVIGDRMSALSFLNVKEIEQVDVLADADATSIYGSRGANGVILITTRKGKAGKGRVNVGLSTGVSKVTKRLELLSTEDYIRLRKDAYASNGQAVPDKSSAIKDFSNYDLTVWDQSRYTDWQKVFFGSSAPTFEANASVSGGNSGVQYLVSGIYGTQKFVFPGTNKYERTGINFSINGASANRKLKAGLNASYATNNGVSSMGDLTALAVKLAPNAPAIYDANGLLNWEPDVNTPNNQGTWDNPYAALLRTSTTSNNNLRGAIELSYEIINNLIIKATAGYSEVRTSNTALTPIASYDPAMTSATGTSLNTNTLAKSVTFDPQLTYNLNIGRGTLSALIGASIQSQESQSLTIFGAGYTSDALLQSISQAPIKQIFNNTTEYKYNAAFGRINYNWENKYIINLSARRDGSSRFGPGEQFGNFGSAGAAWIFSEENFVKQLSKALSFGKLRFSYGTSGNDNIGDYRYLELYEGFPDPNTYQGQTLVRSMGAANPDYHWESVKKIEAALELGFFKDRLILSGAYWQTRCFDQIGLLTLPATSGANNVTSNQDAGIQNMGWDFIVSSKNLVTKNFSWSTSANFGLQNNKLLSKPENLHNEYSLNRRLVVGEPFSGFVYVYEFKGVNPANGLYQFSDNSGNVTTDKDNGYIDARKIKITPLTLGLSNTFSYKNITFTFFAQFTKQMGKNYLTDPVFATTPAGTFSSEPGGERGNRPKAYLDYWKSPGELASFQRLNSIWFAEPDGQLLNKFQNSNMAWVDASFIRLRNIAISYKLPTGIGKHKFLDNASIYLQGQNLLTITNYKGLDTEVQSATALPMLKTIVVGLQLGL